MNRKRSRRAARSGRTPTRSLAAATAMALTAWTSSALSQESAAAEPPPAAEAPPVAAPPQPAPELQSGPAPQAAPQPAPQKALPWTVSAGANQKLGDHPSSLKGETGSRVFEGMGGLSLFADYLGSWNGPMFAAALRLYGAFELHLGTARETDTTSLPCNAASCATTSEHGLGSYAFAYGATLTAISIEGVEAGFGFAGVGNDSFRALPIRISIPLYARWLPFRLPNARVRLIWDVASVTRTERKFSDGIGAGFEWGLL